MAEQEHEGSIAPPWRQYRAMVWRHRHLAVVILGSALLGAGVYTSMQIPLYLASTTVLIENRNQRIVGDVEIGVWLDQEEAKAQRILAKSRPVLERAAHKVAAIGALPGLKAEDVLAEYGSVDAKAQGRLLILEVIHPDPKRAAELANFWNTAFVDESRDRQNSSSIYTRDFLGKQLPDLRQDWIRKQETLQNFQIESNFDPREADVHPVHKRYAELDAKLTSARVRRAALESETKVWEESKASLDFLIQTPRARMDRNLSTYELLLQNQRKKLIEVRQDFLPNSAEVRKAEQALKEMEEVVKRALEAMNGQIKSELRIAQDEVQNLTTLFTQTEKEYLALKSKEAKHKQLAFEAQMAQREYENLAQLQRGADVAGKVELSFAQTWEKAETPGAPFLPSWRRNMTFGFVMGLILAGIAVYLRELLDDSVRSAEQLEARLGVDVIGSVPLVELHWLKNNGYALAREHPRALPVESLRSLRSSLTVSFSAHGNGNGSAHGTVLLLTSPGEGDGKSFLSSNLATLFASVGKKVLLVDMDLHKASLSRYFEHGDAPGLQTLPAGGVTLIDLIRPTSVPNLILLPSGKPGGNPAAAIESPAFVQLLEEARSRYDVVLLDAPPVLAVADACSVAAKADAVLVAVRSRTTRLAQVDRAIESLQRAQAKECMCVVNALDSSDAEAGGYGYGSYNYASGYTYGRRHPNESAQHESVPEETR